MKKLTLPLLGGLLLAGAACADDWPQWLGPGRNNVSKETGLLQSWPKSGPKLLWTFSQAGMGYSAPSIVGDRLYALTADGTLVCANTADGKKVWSKNFPKDLSGAKQNLQWGYSESP